LLPILRGHITNTELGHFVTTLVPLCESIFNLRAQALQAGKTAEVEAKVYEALVEQVWALLPGYCDLPTDLPTALTRTFAELLANVLYAQPNLRPVILRALQVLVEKNKTLAASTGPADSLRASFGLDAAAGKANIVLLAGYAPNLLAVMFNVFGKAGREGGGFVLECIATYLGILSAKVCHPRLGLSHRASCHTGPFRDVQQGRGPLPPRPHRRCQDV
jgi:ribosomal RNA-processing protein 12